MAKTDRSGERVVLTYAYLRKAATEALEHGIANERGSQLDFMLAILGAAFFLEAYFNHLGPEVLPNWEAEGEWEEPKEKLKRLARGVQLPFDFKSSDYQAFTDIFAFRKSLVHGRTHFLSGSWNSAQEGPPATDMLQADWERLGNATDAKRLISAAERIVRALHQAAGKQEDPFESTGWGGSWPEGALPLPPRAV